MRLPGSTLAAAALGAYTYVPLLLVFTRIIALENGIDIGPVWCGTPHSEAVRAEKGDYGNIVLGGSPDAGVNSSCQVIIRACNTCKVRLHVLELRMPECRHDNRAPSTASPDDDDKEETTSDEDSPCIPGCDHLHVFDNDEPYSRVTYRDFFPDDVGKKFLSISANLRFIYCASDSTRSDVDRSFNVTFQILDKNELRQGIAGQYGRKSGIITSPNFPHGYAVNGETFTYVIQNLDPYGHVRLRFLDWEVAQESELKVYDGLTSQEAPLVVRRGGRPVLVSDSNALVLVFNTGSLPRANLPAAGFKLHYEFSSEKAWPDRPNTECSSTQPMQGGGLIAFTGASSQYPTFYDCVWLIRRYASDDGPDSVVVRMREILLGDGWLQYEKLNSLEVRHGTTTDSQLVARYTAANLTEASVLYASGTGLLLRLQGGFYSTDKLSFIFTAITNVTEDGSCPGFDFLCGNLQCIQQDLMCDGVDHCGDGSDEAPVLDCSVSALWKISFKWSMPYSEVIATRPTARRDPCPNHFRCREGLECVLTSQRCDGITHCQDGSDEADCYTAPVRPMERDDRSRGTTLEFSPLCTMVFAAIIAWWNQR